MMIKVFLFFGIVSVAFLILEAKVGDQKKLVLTPDGDIFNLWKNFPVDAPIDFYFFNWTNPEDIYNSSVKPKFEEIGPYRFLQENRKSNIVWNDNGTVSYQQLRYWHSSDEVKSNLEDEITTVNPLAVSFAHAVRSRNFLVRFVISTTLSNFKSSISTTKTIREFLFEGYSDPLLDLSKSFKHLELDMDKFALFYKKNGSTERNKIFNIGTGENNDFGKLYSWNYKNETNFYDGNCNQLSESTGDCFQVPLSKTKISFFSFDLCRVITLEYSGEETVNGLNGYKYIIGNDTLDNGTQYPENLCFWKEESLPSGIFSISACAEGSPFFVSLPHFYKADSYYTDQIEGISSDHVNHEFSITIEPNTGIPLKANIRFQINMLLQPIRNIRLFENVPHKYVLPIMWSEYKAQIGPDTASQIKSYVRNNEIYAKEE